MRLHKVQLKVGIETEKEREQNRLETKQFLIKIAFPNTVFQLF